ncbi:MAG: hypothetical protein JO253_03245 [Alphaproteobacteria bacterium]|nr:hypothetical protein [Alphaproteobacteria bacterium]
MSAISIMTGIPDPILKIGMVAAAAAIAIAAALEYRHALIVEGMKKDADQRDKAATSALLAADAKVLRAQGQITELQGKLSTLQTESQNAQSASLVQETALRAGTERLRADFIAHRTDEAAASTNPTITIVGDGASITEDLAPEVAGNLESLRRNENTAIDRLNACILAYDKVKEQADSLNK